MKKLLFLLLLGVAFQQTNAQYIGIKAGYNYTTMKGEVTQGSSISNNHGFYAGVLMIIPLSDFFAFQPEALYNRVGAKFTSGSVGNSSLLLNYFSIPALARLNVYDRFSLQLGPQFSFLIDNNTFYFEKERVNTAIDSDSIDKFDMSLVVGASYTTQTGWFFDIRYVNGLTSNFESANSSLKTTRLSNDYSFKNAALTAGIGLIF